jgi:hypothetical protein
MIRLITTSRLRQLEAAERAGELLSIRMEEASRWLSEFDWLLEPLWDMTRGIRYIDNARQDMRERLRDKLRSVTAPLSGQGRKIWVLPRFMDIGCAHRAWDESHSHVMSKNEHQGWLVFEERL